MLWRVHMPYVRDRAVLCRQTGDGVRRRWLLPVLGLLLAVWQMVLPAAAETLGFQVTASEPVVVTGSPVIALTVGSQQRTASYVPGNGAPSTTLTFSYAVQPGDFDVDGVQLGSEITGGSFTDVAGNPPPSLTFTPPNTTGVKVQAYSVAFATNPITPENASAISFTISNAPAGASYTYTIASAAGGANITGSGTISAGVTTTVSNVNVSSMRAGTLTLSVTVTHAPGGGAGIPATATATPQFLLDSLGTTASAAFSTRLLRGAYTGPLLQVRRSSDNAQTTIGATIGGLDTAALASHCAGVNCSVSTWYDQSGNSHNAQQATANKQPIIVVAGTLQSFGGRAGLTTQSASQFLTISTGSLLGVAGNTANPQTIVTVARLDSTGAGHSIISNDSPGMFGHGLGIIGTNQAYMMTDNAFLGGANQTFVAGQMAVVSGQWTSTARRMWVNGSNVISTSGDAGDGAAANTYLLALQPDIGGGSKVIQEAIIWRNTTVSDSTRQSIENNQRSWFGIGP